MKFVPQLHHELGIQHLLSNDRAALWAGMGLGKTAMSLAAINDLFQSWKTRGVLVVAPLRVCALTWPLEIQKWDEFNWMKVAHVMTEAGWHAMETHAANVYLVSWDNIAFLSIYFLHGRRAEQLPFDTIIFDESSRARNPESKRVNTLRSYINKFPRRWELTGTPSPRSLLDVFAQIRLLDDGRTFGPSFNAFRAGHFTPLDRFEYNWAPRQGTAEKIHEKCSTFALVLLSSDYLKIPETIVEDVEVPLPPAVKPMYEELVEELLTITPNEETVFAVNRGVLTNKLLQVSGGAVYLEQEYNERFMPLPRKVAVLHDAKIKALQKLIKALAGKNVLVAVNYQHEQQRVHAAIPGSVRFDSAKTPAQLTAMEKSWNAGLIQCLIAHPASIGHGLNLQDGGETVIWYSQTWDRELYDQLNARLARMGQDEITYIYRLVCPGTMDDAVIETLKERGDTQHLLLQAVENLRKMRAVNLSFTKSRV